MQANNKYINPTKPKTIAIFSFNVNKVVKETANSSSIIDNIEPNILARLITKMGFS